MKTLALGIKLVAINNPEGVLYAKTHVSIRPVLCFKASNGVKHFVNGITIDVVAGWEEVSGHQGVVEHTLANTILRVLLT